MQSSTHFPNCFLHEPPSGFFLPQIYFLPFKQGSYSHLLHLFVHQIEQDQAGRAFIGTVYWHTSEPPTEKGISCGTVRRWWIYCMIPLPYPWHLICEPRLSERSCWMYPNPVKRKTTPPSQEWHHAPLPNHKSGSSLLVIRGPQNFPLGYNK